MIIKLLLFIVGVSALAPFWGGAVQFNPLEAMDHAKIIRKAPSAQSINCGLGYIIRRCGEAHTEELATSGFHAASTGGVCPPSNPGCACGWNAYGSQSYPAPGKYVLAECVSGSEFKLELDHIIPVFPQKPYRVELADLDGDGNLDIVVANRQEKDYGSLVLFGNGDGTFQPKVDLGTVRGAEDIAIGDFNQDNLKDIVLAFKKNNNSDGEEDKIYFNNGNRTFTEVELDPGFDAETRAVTAGDYNADGFTDIAIAGRNIDPLLYRGEAGGTFKPPIPLDVPANHHVFAMKTADLDSDGDLDIFWGTTDNSSQKSFVNINAGAPTFGLSSLQETMLRPSEDKTRDVAVGDLNNDGFLDAILANGDVNGSSPNRVLIGNGSPNGANSGFPIDYHLSESNSTWGAGIGDLNGDGVKDLIFGNDEEPDFYYLGELNDGVVSYPEPKEFESYAGHTKSVDVGDLNGDGLADVVAGLQDEREIRIYLSE